MSPKKIKFRNILGELSVAKLYGGELSTGQKIKNRMAKLPETLVQYGL